MKKYIVFTVMTLLLLGPVLGCGRQERRGQPSPETETAIDAESREAKDNDEKRKEIENAFQLYKTGKMAEFWEQPHEIKIAVLKKALSVESMIETTLGRISFYDKLEAWELVPHVIRIAREKSGRIRLLAIRLIYERIPDKRAVPILIEYCLDDDYEKTHRQPGKRGRDITVNSVFYESAHALYIITEGKVGVKSPIHILSNPDAVVAVLRTEGLPEKIKKWWTENKEKFLKEIEKEY